MHCVIFRGLYLLLNSSYHLDSFVSKYSTNPFSIPFIFLSNWRRNLCEIMAEWGCQSELIQSPTTAVKLTMQSIRQRSEWNEKDFSFHKKPLIDFKWSILWLFLLLCCNRITVNVHFIAISSLL